MDSSKEQALAGGVLPTIAPAKFEVHRRRALAGGVLPRLLKWSFLPHDCLAKLGVIQGEYVLG